MESALAAYFEQQNTAYSRVKNAFVAELLGDLRGLRFLDYGCGAGWFTVHAAEAGAVRVVGVDAEETALSTARHFARERGVERLCQFMHEERFPWFFPGVEFDAILIKDVLEHVEEDDDLLAAAASVLAPGGRLVVSTQNSWSLNFLIEGFYQRGLRCNKDWCGWDPTHVRFYTPFSIQRKLEDVGLTVRGWRSVYLIPHKIPLGRRFGRRFLRIDALTYLDRALGTIFPFSRLGWNFVVRAIAPEHAPVKAPSEQLIAEKLPAAPVLPPSAVTRTLRGPNAPPSGGALWRRGQRADICIE